MNDDDKRQMTTTNDERQMTTNDRRRQRTTMDVGFSDVPSPSLMLLVIMFIVIPDVVGVQE
jgi:hypothetical protein